MSRFSLPVRPAGVASNLSQEEKYLLNLIRDIQTTGRGKRWAVINKFLVRESLYRALSSLEAACLVELSFPGETGIHARLTASVPSPK